MSSVNKESGFDADWRFGDFFEKELDGILFKGKAEVKSERASIHPDDKKWDRTGNIFVEYKREIYASNQLEFEKSGINVTQSEYFVVFLGKDGEPPSSSLGIIFQTKALIKYLIYGVRHLGFRKDVHGGDGNRARGVLLPIIRMHEVAKFNKSML